MKKKNIIKKFLSVMLSAAMLFSLLALPAYAVVPGEDAYGGAQEEGYIRVDFENQTTEFVSKSDIPKFMGDSTYDVLNPAERARLTSINNEILASKYEEPFLPSDVVDGEYHYVSPVYQLYSGIVIISTWRDEVYQGYGTGFLLDEDTFMTSLHVIYDGYVNDEIDMSQGLPDEIRIHYGISQDIVMDDLLETLERTAEVLDDDSNYVTMSRGVFSSAVLPENNGNDCEYDWFLGKLSTPLTGRYYWDCMVPTTSLRGKTSYLVGYPTNHRLQMVETVGVFYGVGESTNGQNANNIWYSNSNETNMSGGPVYGDWGGVKCYGVHFGASGTLSMGVKIYYDLFNVIADFMEE